VKISGQMLFSGLPAQDVEATGNYISEKKSSIRYLFSQPKNLLSPRTDTTRKSARTN